MLNGAWPTRAPSAVLAVVARIAVAFALVVVLPVSQLRLVSMIVECCCPDPDHCQCPDHKSGDSPHATLEPCHRTVTTIESASAPSFAPVAVVELVPARALVATHHAHATPHEPPTPERPSAPS
jgi:hypothetical protein